MSYYMNPNLRIVWDNIADTGQLAATSHAGSLVVGNLRSDLKSRVWRGQSTEETLFLEWSQREPIGAIVMAFTNFTSFAEVRARGYEYSTSLFPDWQTDWVKVAPPGGLGHFQWGAPLGENFYARGGANLFGLGYGGYGTLWVEEGQASTRVEIDIRDPQNPDGYLEFGRLIVGPWWAPKFNFDFGYSLEFGDNSSNERTEAGDLRGEAGARWRKLSIPLSWMSPEDRSAILRLFRRHGLSKPFFISPFPNHEDVMKEQAHQMWGKLVSSGKITEAKFDIFATQLEIEEM